MELPKNFIIYQLSIKVMQAHHQVEVNHLRLKKHILSYYFQKFQLRYYLKYYSLNQYLNHHLNHLDRGLHHLHPLHLNEFQCLQHQLDHRHHLINYQVIFVQHQSIYLQGDYFFVGQYDHKIHLNLPQYGLMNCCRNHSSLLNFQFSHLFLIFEITVISLLNHQSFLLHQILMVLQYQAHQFRTQLTKSLPKTHSSFYS